MSETYPQSPGMLLQAAARLASFPAKDGWPESLTPAQLGRLQYPDEGDVQERRRLRNCFIAVVNSAIEAGQLLTVAVKQNADAQQGVSTMQARARTSPARTRRRSFVTGWKEWPEWREEFYAENGLGSPEWRAEFSRAPRPAEKAASGTIQRITREACVSWFIATREIPRSEYVRAWLGDFWQDEASSVPASLVIVAKSSGGEWATTRDVRTVFAALLLNSNSFNTFARALADAPDWIKKARGTAVGKGKSSGYWWDVAVLAEAITEHFNLNRAVVHKAIKDRWPNAADIYSP